MTVNITIVVQVLNFLFAYWILERFLFRYTIAIIQKRDEHARMRSESLAFQNQSNETLRVHINEQWQRYQRALHSEVPSIENPATKPISMQLKPLEEINQASLQQAARPLEKILYDSIVQE
jgi:F0F1-type ATP synthase membrane subunit b/b'